MSLKRLLLATPLLLVSISGTQAADPSVTVAALQQPAHASVANPWAALDPAKLRLRSASALVEDQLGRTVYAKQANESRPIASITKLMTAMVTLDANLPLDERIQITKADRDTLKYTGSRLEIGATLTREEMIRLALMASENRAASALGRSYPGGEAAFVKAMNRKARALGMKASRFVDPAGLDAGNVASASDVAAMARAALKYPLIRKATTSESMTVRPYKRRGELRFVNTNRLMKNDNWEIKLSKTGYISEAGRCLAMQAEIANQPLLIVLLNSYGKLTPIGDSNRIRKWIEREIKG